MGNNSLINKEHGQVQIQPFIVDSDSEYGYDYAGAGNTESQKHQFFRVIAILRKRWWLILASILLITSFVVVYQARQPDYFRSTARIQVNNEMNPAVGGSTVVTSQANDPSYFSTQLQILEGTNLLRRVAKSMDLEHNEAFLNPGKNSSLNTWQKVLRMFDLYRPETVSASKPDSQPANGLDLAFETSSNLEAQAEVLAPYVNTMKNGLSVMPITDNRTASKETRLIRVEFSHGDPVVAAKVANAIADVYVLQNLERKVETNASASDFLQKKVASLTMQIRSDEERLINYSNNRGIISLDSAQNTVVQRLGDLNSKLSAAESERLTAETAYKAAMQNPMSDVAAENSDGRTTAIEGQLTTLRQQLAQLKTEFTDEWPEVKRVKQQIALLEAEFKENRKRATQTKTAQLLQTYQEAAQRERELRSNFESQRGAVLQQNEAAINYRIIEQEIGTNKKLLDSLLQKERETEVILNGTPNNVYVADRASVPGSPEGPQRMKSVLTALIASLFVGVGLAFLVNWLDDTVRVYDDVEAKLGTPVIGQIPGVRVGAGRRFFSNRKLLTNGNGNGSAAIVSYVSEQPIISEAFNQVRTSLLLSSVGKTPRTVLVTSGQPTEGKTFTSLNLAKSLSQLGGKVLLIDADLRCPKQHLINGLSNEKGLSNLLSLPNLDQRSIDDAIVKSVAPDLDVMTSGPLVPHPANLLGLSKMSSLLVRLGAYYRHIIIDSPPALYFADSIMLASNVDAVVLVGRVNFSSRELLLLAKKKLQGIRANVVGIVLNDVPSSNYPYSHYGDYSQYEEAGNLHGNGNGDGGKILDLE